MISNGERTLSSRLSVLKDNNFLYLSGVWLSYNGTNTVAQAEYIIQPRIAPPTAPAVSQQTNSYTVISEVVNIVSWTASSSSSVNSYIIYRNQSQVGQVALNFLTFTDHNQTLNESVTYTIYAVDINSVESIGATVSFP